MSTQQRVLTPHNKVIDLTQMPYFSEAVTPAEDNAVIVLPDLVDYSEQRAPAPSDPNMHLGGLGLAAVLDVHAHPIRAQARRTNWMTVLAVSAIGAVALMMVVLAAFRY